MDNYQCVGEQSEFYFDAKLRFAEIKYSENVETISFTLLA